MNKVQCGLRWRCVIEDESSQVRRHKQNLLLLLSQLDGFLLRQLLSTQGMMTFSQETTPAMILSCATFTSAPFLARGVLNVLEGQEGDGGEWSVGHSRNLSNCATIPTLTSKTEDRQSRKEADGRLSCSGSRAHKCDLKSVALARPSIGRPVHSTSSPLFRS